MAAFISFLIGILSQIAADLLFKLNFIRLIPNSFTRFWDRMLSGGLVIITPAQEEEPEIKSQVLDFQGLEVLKGVFQQYYPKLYKQTSCNDVNRDTLNNHLLLVAGPVANTVTKHILKPENNSVRYYFKDHSIVDKYHPEVSLTEELIQQGMYPEFDYGIISFLKNPFNSKKHVIISSGVYGWGTYGGLLVISDKESLSFSTKLQKARISKC